MHVFKGIAASPGIAIGPAYVLKAEAVSVEKKKIPSTNVAWEVRRYKQAAERALEDLDKVGIKMHGLFGKKYAQLMDAHKLILQDPMLTESVVKKIETESITAEAAIYHAAQELAANFENIQNETMRERKFDVADVAKRILENLSEKKHNKFSAIGGPVVVIAHNLYPSDTINLKNKNVLGFATDIGGKTSHTAILAQGMKMPAVVGLSSAARDMKNGDLVIIDGENGLLILNPDGQTLDFYKKQQLRLDKAEEDLKTISSLPNVTKDGHKVSLYVNYDPRRDLKDWDSFVSDGLGLLRTEFLYIDRPVPPPEEEQFTVYKKAAQRFEGRPATIRLADLGGDKADNFGLYSAQEENPFMGCRGVRFFLKYPDLLETQLRAIIRAAAAAPAQIKIMIPMVCDIEEVCAVRKYFNKVLEEMAGIGIKPRMDVQLGVMVEVPSAALTMDAILQEADFISIGTNDLIQYLLAVDRVNQEVADLYDPYHPAVLRTINFIIQAARKKGKPVSVCGEIASDPEMIPFLVGMGVDILSVTPRMFLRIKNALRNLNFKDCSNLAQAAILLGSSKEIKRLKEYYRTDEEYS